jgi:Plexin cytoplasmic RasGAP domain
MDKYFSLDLQDSPASKLLFAKDVPQYRQLVVEFYRGIKEKQPITDDEMERLMVDMSRVK